MKSRECQTKIEKNRVKYAREKAAGAGESEFARGAPQLLEEADRSDRQRAFHSEK